jgi:DNA repair exonuclease SbcCD ATPase subunit
MKQAFDFPRMIKDNKLAQDAHALYLFFIEAEISGTRFTYAAIHDHFPRSPSNISKYVRNYWSWFLRREPKKLGRANTFSCHGLKDYPAFYFVMAHQRNQGQYYRHFSEALLKAKERDQARRAKLQETIEIPSSPSPNVPGQQDPEELHIEELPPDEEVEEDEMKTAQPLDRDEEIQVEEDEMETEQPPDRDEEIQAEDDGSVTAEIVKSKGRISLMSIFTLDKQLERIRAEFAQRMDLLEQRLTKEVQRPGKAQQPPALPEIFQVLKKLELLQEHVLALSPLASQSTPVLERAQEMATRIQAIEQALAQLPEKLELLQKQVQESLLSLPEQLELLQAQASNLSTSIALMPTQLEQLQTKIDGLLSWFTQKPQLLPILQELQRQVDKMAQPSSVPNTLEQLQEQVNKISSQVTSTAEVFDVLQQMSGRPGTELVPVIPSGEQKPDDFIHASIQKAIEAINILEQDLTTWLDRHDAVARQSRRADAEKLLQDITLLVRVHIVDEQENIYVSTEAQAPGEQNVPLLDQLSEIDTANERAEEGSILQPNEDEA